MLAALAVVAATVALTLTGAMAGLFFSFSVAVMLALDDIAAGHAIPAMQSINRRILNPVFLFAFIGAPIAAGLTGALLLALGQRAAALICFAATAVYLLGALAPTAAANVPMNAALEGVIPPSDADEAARLWSDYSARWTRWNTLRAGFSAISLLLVGLAVFAWGRRW